MLTQTLRNLERDGFVLRTVNFNSIPISVIYSLTDLGKSLAEPIDSIRQWTERYIHVVEDAQKEFDKKKLKEKELH